MTLQRSRCFSLNSANFERLQYFVPRTKKPLAKFLLDDFAIFFFFLYIATSPSSLQCIQYPSQSSVRLHFDESCDQHVHAASSGLVASPNPIAAIPFARASGKGLL